MFPFLYTILNLYTYHHFATRSPLYISSVSDNTHLLQTLQALIYADKSYSRSTQKDSGASITEIEEASVSSIGTVCEKQKLRRNKERCIARQDNKNFREKNRFRFPRKEQKCRCVCIKWIYV